VAADRPARQQGATRTPPGARSLPRRLGAEADRRLEALPKAAWVAVALALTSFTLGLAWTVKEDCLGVGWSDGHEYRHECYTDLLVFWETPRGLHEDKVPYF
jgi:hypothetical protein